MSTFEILLNTYFQTDMPHAFLPVAIRFSDIKAYERRCLDWMVTVLSDFLLSKCVYKICNFQMFVAELFNIPWLFLPSLITQQLIAIMNGRL